ncbi:molybdopterin cofactor-binding domain-containing protein [Vibrio parahaemolyticus]|uniref:molybdopterin cofactor-binding domain-containing protein n=1 Tax=Vibrio mediterranei TaxID=689 RepID=UPI004068C97D
MNEAGLGSRMPRVDGRAKVEGTAVYGDDVYIQGALHGVCRYTDIPAGRILSIDITDAMKVKGVVRIVTYDDIPGDPKVGVIIRDFYPVCKEWVRYSGDVVALVIAENYQAACEASERICIEYEPFQPITEPVQALKESARLIHPDKTSNVVNTHHTVKGDAKKAIADADVVIEHTYQTHFQEHGYIEPESITTYLDPSTNELTITGSIQNPHRVRSFVAGFLGVPQASINVKRSVLGGSFGGKDDTIDHLACRAALSTYLTKRAVKFSYNREQSLKESTKRHPYSMRYKVGVSHEGKIAGIEISIVADAGAYATCTPFVTWRSSVQAAGPYDIDHVHVEVTGVYTNNSVSGAMRGFGSPQIIFAHESLMDEIALACNLDPVTVRERNVLQQGSLSMTGQCFDQHTVSASQVLQTAAEKSNFYERMAQLKAQNKVNSPVKYGIGLALSYRGCSLGAEGADNSSALVCLNADSSLNISTGVCENGQGLQTTMAMIASEVLGLPLDNVHFSESPTSLIADGGPTVASRATMTGGNAVKQGAETIRARLFDTIKQDLQVSDVEETVWKEGQVFVRDNTQKSVPLQEAINRCRQQGINLAAYGWFDPPPIHWDEEKGTGSPYFTWVYGCQVAEVKVDTATGKVEVLGVTAVHDVGKVINPVGFEGQVAGGIAQGIGFGILEDYNIEQGEVKSDNFDTYLMPTIKDIPPLTIHAIENPDPSGPYGAKSIGEPAAELAAAAIGNAVAFATKTRHRTLPLTLEQVFLGYNLKKPVRQSELLCGDNNHHQVNRLGELDIVRPDSLEGALRLIKQSSLTVIAGGTDVIVQQRLQQTANPLLDISCLNELKVIVRHGNELILGSGSTIADVVEHEAVRNHFPLLARACKTIGSTQIRNRATLGGNIANAAPCADSLPPLIAYQAEVELASEGEVRRLPIHQLLKGGYKTDIRCDELLTKIILTVPDKPFEVTEYVQLGRRNALNITRLSLSCLITTDGGVVKACRLVDGALFSYPRRLEQVEAVICNSTLDEEVIGRAISVLADMIETEIGGRWSAAYKQPVYLNMFRELMIQVRSKIAHHKLQGEE